MQVHAVPDHERHRDSTGHTLPWAYAFADGESRSRLHGEEKGPFGKARKRGTSRTKTATPGRKEDQAKVDNLRVIDDIFNRHKDSVKAKESLRQRKPSGPSSSLPMSASTPNLGESVGLGASFQAGASGSTNVTKEPTEVLLYGFGNDYQWSAIDYYEKVSRGLIYEDYDRFPPTAKYNLSLNANRTASLRSLSKAAIRKTNEYVGGEHWIKVTFDSPEAAERACHYSPHPISGYMVFAERYRGTGPNQDIAIPATSGPIASQTASPQTTSTTIAGSSQTASSATATTAPSTLPPRQRSEPLLTSSFPSSEPALIPTNLSTAHTTSAQPPQSETKKLTIRGAKRAILRPADEAFLPVAPRWQQTFSAFPIIGWLVGSGHGIIGDQVPRKEDGSFDHANASVYWRFWYAVDQCFGSDFCGVRGEEYDD